MKESHAEGLASHGDHESCADICEGIREALTVACAGWVLSPEKSIVQSADVMPYNGRQHQPHRYSEMRLDSAWSKTPYMHRNSLHGNREVPHLTGSDRGPVRSGNPEGASR